MIGSEAEQAVIGSVLLDSRSFRFVDEELEATDFGALQFEQVFSGIAAMISAGEPVDVLTVGHKLGQWGVRGLSATDLHQLVTNVPHTAGAASYARIVHEEAVRRSIRVAAQRALQIADGSEFEPGEAIASAISEFREIQSGASRQELPAKTLREVLAGDDDYDWVIPNLLERRDRLILTGAEGHGKSTLVRQLAIASASGVHPTTFEKIEPVRVLVVDAENSEKQWRRAARWPVQMGRSEGSVDPSDALHLSCAPRLDLTRDAHLGQVHRLIDRFTPDVLFIGPLYRLSPRAINSDDDAAPLLAALDTLRDRGLALVMEAHAGHAIGAGGNRDLRPRGSSSLMGWPEFGKGLRKTDDTVIVDSVNDASGKRTVPIFELEGWRGDRDTTRQWPERIHAGGSGYWDWTPYLGF